MIGYRLLSPASKELERVVEYYSGIDPALALGFLDEFDRSIDLVCSFPEAWGKMDSRYRRFLIRRFPYGIIYRQDESEIVVTAIMHLHSDPESWKDLL